MYTKEIRKWLWLLLVAVMSVGLTGCGDNDEPEYEQLDQRYVGFWYCENPGGATWDQAFYLASDGKATGIILNNGKITYHDQFSWNNTGLYGTRLGNWAHKDFGAVSQKTLWIGENMHRRITEEQWISLNETGRLE